MPSDDPRHREQPSKTVTLEEMLARLSPEERAAVEQRARELVAEATARQKRRGG